MTSMCVLTANFNVAVAGTASEGRGSAMAMKTVTTDPMKKVVEVKLRDYPLRIHLHVSCRIRLYTCITYMYVK